MMKKYNCFVAGVLIFLLTSCLNSNLEELPEFGDANITGVQRVEYRYYSATDTSRVDGLPIVKYVTLTNAATINGETVSIEVTVPEASSTLPASEREKVSTSNIAVMVALSTAARLTPMDGAPLLGIPGDWSKPNKYKVTAANGTTKTWTIQISKFSK